MMPFQKIVHTSRAPRRVLEQGRPNSGKTRAFLTWPRADGTGDHAHYLACPGEKGWETIPTDLPDLLAERWESNPAEKSSSGAVVSAVEARVFEILAEPGLTSLMVDGFHKYYGYVLDSITGGLFFAGEPFDPLLYARTHERAKFFMDRVLGSPVPYIVFTCWDGREADSPEAAAVLKSKAPSHIFPDLPGKMAKRVMGEFPIVLYNDLKYDEKGNVAAATWQLRPHGAVWGAAIKAPDDVVNRLPVTIPQDFRVLAQVLQGAWDPPLSKPIPPRG